MRPIAMITLLPKRFHVAPARAEPTPQQRSAAQTFVHAKRLQRAEWIARYQRRGAFIAAERLSPAEAAHLPLDFDPALTPEREL